MKILILSILLLSFPSNSSKEPKIFQLSDKIIFEDSSVTRLSLDDLDINKEDRINICVRLNYAPFIMAEDLETDIYSYRNSLFEEGKKYHIAHNEELINKIDITRMDDLYIDKYAPYFYYSSSWGDIIENNYASLMELAVNEDVSEIIVRKEIEFVPEMITATNFIEVKETIDNGIFTGQGIVVGILEDGGSVDKNHANFFNSDITIKNGTPTEHATKVASIIGGTYGIAPQAKILSAEITGSNGSAEINWMMDRKVNVVNMSFGDKYPTGYYSSVSAYYDYISNIYKITFVSSAGNNGESNGYITNPGLGYNVLTVGSCSSNSNLPSPFSSYVEMNGPSKPNFLAPGGALLINGFAGGSAGTSYSAAITTGCVVLLMQATPAYISHPERLMAVLSANTEKISQSNTASGLNDVTGAGRINFKDTLLNKNNFIFRYINFTSFFEYAMPITLYANTEVRAALAWMAKADGSVNGTKLTDFDLWLTDSNGNILTKSDSINNPIEFIQYKITYTGTYYLSIKQYGSMQQYENLCLYYNTR